MFEGILQKFPAAQGTVSILYPYQQHNVMLDYSITSVGERLSRECFTRALDSREYPLNYWQNRQNPEISRTRLVKITTVKYRGIIRGNSKVRRLP